MALENKNLPAPQTQNWVPKQSKWNWQIFTTPAEIYREIREFDVVSYYAVQVTIQETGLWISYAYLN